MECDCRDCCEVTVPKISPQLVALSQQTDWILFPDVCQNPTITVFRDVAPVQPKFCEKTENDLHHRQDHEAKEPGEVLREECDRFSEATYIELWTTKCSSPNTAEVRYSPPSRPTPQRLPTPDLPEIEEADFWSCYEPSDSYRKDTYGTVAKHHELQQLR
jgi:hypothetical protein